MPLSSVRQKWEKHSIHIIAGLDKINSGLIEWQGDDIAQWDDKKIATFRNTEIGFIFQFHHLLPEFSAIENVMIPAIIHGKSRERERERERERTIR